MSDTLKPMTGKICMVTGATSGIGAATALALAQQGATTIVVGRNLKRCRQIVNRIKAKTGNSFVEYLLADLEFWGRPLEYWLITDCGI